MQGSVTGYGEDYYEKHLGDQPYVPDSPDFRAFFDSVGEAVVSRFRPRTSLDVGCAMGFLVAELAKRGVDASGLILRSTPFPKRKAFVRAFPNGSRSDRRPNLLRADLIS